MILKSGPHLELHLPSKSIQPQLEGDILTSSNLPSLHYCLCWRSSILTTPFMQWYGNCLSCFCSQESLIFPVPTHRELCFTTEPARGGRRAWISWAVLTAAPELLGTSKTHGNSVLIFPLCHMEDILLQSTPEHPQEREMMWRRKRGGSWSSPGGN